MCEFNLILEVPYFTKVVYDSGVRNCLSKVIFIVCGHHVQFSPIYLNCFLLKPFFSLSNVTLFIDQWVYLLFRYLKLWQNKKGRIFVCDARKMVSAVKTPFLVHCKQIFIPSYFIRALSSIIWILDSTIHGKYCWTGWPS